MIECLIVGMGGFIGAILRYLTGLIPVGTEGGFPIKTLLVNVIGSFVIGIIAALAVKNTAINPRLVLFIKVGICGGFTTFSSFALETGTLLENGQTLTAILYIIMSVIFSIFAVFTAEWIVR
ncbi:MAG: fluoride efflux transporter CrcB [Clostridia bacterium]|nr:fluoride efflux transporter CrcB [Clostridia bacterium]MBQ3462997.1 fluoride efflux transporter CrcB [Clostridia bacterium]MBQ3471929.1 fluoride efflux transporter CrcB [Clostridia bacterium]